MKRSELKDLDSKYGAPPKVLELLTYVDAGDIEGFNKTINAKDFDLNALFVGFPLLIHVIGKDHVLFAEKLVEKGANIYFQVPIDGKQAYVVFASLLQKAACDPKWFPLLKNCIEKTVRDRRYELLFELLEECIRFAQTPENYPRLTIIKSQLEAIALLVMSFMLNTCDLSIKRIEPDTGQELKLGSIYFFYACVCDWNAVVKLILETPHFPLDKEATQTSLLYACKHEKFSLAKILLEKNVTPNITDREGISLLGIMIFKNQLAFVKLLLEFNANITSVLMRSNIHIDPNKIPDLLNKSPLAELVPGENARDLPSLSSIQDAITKYISQASDVELEQVSSYSIATAEQNNPFDCERKTILIHAIQKGYGDIILELVKKALTNVKISTTSCYVIMHEICKYGDKELLNAVLNLFAQNHLVFRKADLELGLCLACAFGNLNLVNELITVYGADINIQKVIPAQDYDFLEEVTPLSLALRRNQEKTVAFLIEYGAHFDVEAIAYACVKGFTPVFKAMHKRGCDINQSDQFGKNLFFYACLSQQTALIEYFLKMGVDFILPDPLHDEDSLPVEAVISLVNVLCALGRVDLLEKVYQNKLLLNVNENYNGGNYLEVAIDSHQPASLEWLINKGARINKKLLEYVIKLNHSAPFVFLFDQFCKQPCEDLTAHQILLNDLLTLSCQSLTSDNASELMKIIQELVKKGAQLSFQLTTLLDTLSPCSANMLYSLLENMPAESLPPVVKNLEDNNTIHQTLVVINTFYVIVHALSLEKLNQHLQELLPFLSSFKLEKKGFNPKSNDIIDKMLGKDVAFFEKWLKLLSNKGEKQEGKTEKDYIDQIQRLLSGMVTDKRFVFLAYVVIKSIEYLPISKNTIPRIKNHPGFKDFIFKLMKLALGDDVVRIQFKTFGKMNSPKEWEKELDRAMGYFLNPEFISIVETPAAIARISKKAEKKLTPQRGAPATVSAEVTPASALLPTLTFEAFPEPAVDKDALPSHAAIKILEMIGRALPPEYADKLEIQVTGMLASCLAAHATEQFTSNDVDAIINISPEMLLQVLPMIPGIQGIILHRLTIEKPSLEKGGDAFRQTFPLIGFKLKEFQIQILCEANIPWCFRDFYATSVVIKLAKGKVQILDESKEGISDFKAKRLRFCHPRLDEIIKNEPAMILRILNRWLDGFRPNRKLISALTRNFECVDLIPPFRLHLFDKKHACRKDTPYSKLPGNWSVLEKVKYLLYHQVIANPDFFLRADKRFMHEDESLNKLDNLLQKNPQFIFNEENDSHFIYNTIDKYEKNLGIKRIIQLLEGLKFYNKKTSSQVFENLARKILHILERRLDNHKLELNKKTCMHLWECISSMPLKSHIHQALVTLLIQKTEAYILKHCHNKYLNFDFFQYACLASGMQLVNDYVKLPAGFIALFCYHAREAMIHHRMYGSIEDVVLHTISILYALMNFDIDSTFKKEFVKTAFSHLWKVTDKLSLRSDLRFVEVAGVLECLRIYRDDIENASVLLKLFFHAVTHYLERQDHVYFLQPLVKAWSGLCVEDIRDFSDSEKLLTLLIEHTRTALMGVEKNRSEQGEELLKLATSILGLTTLFQGEHRPLQEFLSRDIFKQLLALQQTSTFYFAQEGSTRACLDNLLVEIQALTPASLSRASLAGNQAGLWHQVVSVNDDVNEDLTKTNQGVKRTP